MIIRNLPYEELNENEKKIVDIHWKQCGCCCDCEDCEKSVQYFWETHREEDTEDGKFDGWKSFEEVVSDNL